MPLSPPPFPGFRDLSRLFVCIFCGVFWDRQTYEWVEDATGGVIATLPVLQPPRPVTDTVIVIDLPTHPAPRFLFLVAILLLLGIKPIV